MKNKERVHRYLASGKTLTAFDGFKELGIVSVRDYISLLKADGVPISSEWRYNADFSKRFKEYFIDNSKIV
jgi:hypothetical protein